jgi:prepilin-type N-terminal cleavage/methylation domain-containing protein
MHNFSPPRSAKQGFSLVELSIVLVILGLLIGGILSGQSLIRASELRAVSVDYQRYSAATQSFRDKYFAIPGDMANAVRFWGAAAGGTADGSDATCTALTTGSTTATTCNGNGNGIVEIGTYEQWRFWQHMANAGLIEGQYSGVAGPGGVYHSIPGTNAPRGRISSSGWHAEYYALAADNTSDYIQSGNRLTFGAIMANERPRAALLKPEEAWNIDTKMDDGKNGTGKLITWASSANPGCGTSDTSTASAYNLSSSAATCALIFKNSF